MFCGRVWVVLVFSARVWGVPGVFGGCARGVGWWRVGWCLRGECHRERAPTRGLRVGWGCGGCGLRPGVVLLLVR